MPSNIPNVISLYIRIRLRFLAFFFFVICAKQLTIGYLFFCFDENETTQSEHFYVVTAELTKKTEATKKFVAPIHSICMKCHGDIVKPTGGKMLN